MLGVTTASTTTPHPVGRTVGLLAGDVEPVGQPHVQHLNIGRSLAWMGSPTGPTTLNDVVDIVGGDGDEHSLQPRGRRRRLAHEASRFYGPASSSVTMRTTGTGAVLLSSKRAL